MLTFDLVQSLHDLSDISIILPRGLAWSLRQCGLLCTIWMRSRGRVQELPLVLEKLLLRILIKLLEALSLYLLLNYELFLTGLIQDVGIRSRWNPLEVLRLCACLPVVVSAILVILHLLPKDLLLTADGTQGPVHRIVQPHRGRRPADPEVLWRLGSLRSVASALALGS